MDTETAASPWVVRFAHLAPDFLPALDVACGGGRHTRLFLEQGLKVTAVDIDLSGVGDLDSDRNVTLLNRDLEDGTVWPFETQGFGTVLVTNYLHRPLMPSLVAAVAPDGVLIYETFALGNEAFGRPGNPDHLLEPGELIEAVRGKLQIVAYEHGYFQEPQPSVRQRICAVNSQNPVEWDPA